MKVVEIRLHAMQDGEVVWGRATVERLRDSKWVPERVFEASSRETSSRRIWLETDQRLVIEAEADQEVVVGEKGQNVAVKRQRDPTPRLRMEEEERRLAEVERQIDEQISREAKLEAKKRL